MPKVEVVERVVEIPQIQEVIRHVPVPQIVDVPFTRHVHVPKVEIQTVEQVRRGEERRLCRKSCCCFARCACGDGSARGAEVRQIPVPQIIDVPAPAGAGGFRGIDAEGGFGGGRGLQSSAGSSGMSRETGGTGGGISSVDTVRVSCLCRG